MGTLVWLEVIDADGIERSLWEDEERCLLRAQQMEQGRMTYDGRPTQVKALVCVEYREEHPNAHIHFPLRKSCRWDNVKEGTNAHTST